MGQSPRLAGVVYKRFEIISWVFTILMIASLYYSAAGIYNYAAYGNCNGPNSDEFCIFNPLGTYNSNMSAGAKAGEDLDLSKKLTVPSVDDDPSFGDKNAKVQIIEFGCFKCPYTKRAAPFVKKIMEEYGEEVYFVYRDFPISDRHLGSEEASEAAQCAYEQGKYWDYYFKLFESQEQSGKEFYIKLAGENNLNLSQFENCLEIKKYKEEVAKDLQDGLSAGIYGTPTFFINNQTVIGPKAYEELKKVIEAELR